MLISLSNQAVLGPEVLDYLFLFVWVLDHLFESTATPIEIEAFTNDQVIVVLVLAKERLGNAPGALRPGALLRVEGAPRHGFEENAGLGRQAHRFRLNGPCLIDEFREGNDKFLVFICISIVANLTLPQTALVFLHEDLLLVLINKCLLSKILRILHRVIEFDSFRLVGFLYIRYLNRIGTIINDIYV